jgi:hypothetical protein
MREITPIGDPSKGFQIVVRPTDAVVSRRKWASIQMSKDLFLNVWVGAHGEKLLEGSGFVQNLGDLIDVSFERHRSESELADDDSFFQIEKEQGEDVSYLGTPIESSKVGGVPLGVGGQLPQDFERAAAEGFRLVVQLAIYVPPLSPGIFGLLAREPLNKKENWRWFWDIG